MRDREAYNNKSKCLGAMLFEEQAQIFEQLIIFYAPSSVFVSRYLLKKEPWSTSVKSSTLICLSIAVVKVPRNCWERSLNIAVIKYFQNDTLKKKNHSSDGRRFHPTVLSHRCFWTKNKNENTEYYNKAISFKSQL